MNEYMIERISSQKFKVLKNNKVVKTFYSKNDAIDYVIIRTSGSSQLKNREVRKSIERVIFEQIKCEYCNNIINDSDYEEELTYCDNCPEILSNDSYEIVNSNKTINDFNNNLEYTLITDNFDIKKTLDSHGLKTNSYGGGLIKIGEGEYIDVLLFSGNVPGLNKRLDRIKAIS